MNSKQLTLWLLIILFIGQNSIYGQKIYLSPSGSDLNPGTREFPVASLTAARDLVRDLRKTGNITTPVEIIALEGEYFMLQPLSLTPEDTGTEAVPLVFKAEPGSKVVFRGGVPIEGFEKVNDNLWRSFVPQVAFYDSYFEQLYVNGKRAVRAKTPNEGFYFIFIGLSV